MAPKDNREVIVCMSEEDPFRVTLDVFLADNDGLDREQIVRDLARWGAHRGGGGAAPVFLIFDPPEHHEWAAAA